MVPLSDPIPSSACILGNSAGALYTAGALNSAVINGLAHTGTVDY